MIGTLEALRKNMVFNKELGMWTKEITIDGELVTAAVEVEDTDMAITFRLFHNKETILELPFRPLLAPTGLKRTEVGFNRFKKR